MFRSTPPPYYLMLNMQTKIIAAKKLRCPPSVHQCMNGSITQRASWQFQTLINWS